jgi:hypothetical protein
MINKSLLVGLCFGALTTGAIAQSSATPITVEIATSIAPNDKIPAYFNSEEELKQHVDVKIKECKEMIVKFQNDLAKAQFYREELWRYEHAEVKESK